MLETFGPLVLTALAALLLGLKVGKVWSRRLLWILLALWVACFMVYAAALNYSRTADDLHWLRSVAQLIAKGGWLSLYAASGLFGPAIAKPSAMTVIISTIATLIVLTAGTWLMFMLACGFASDCI